MRTRQLAAAAAAIALVLPVQASAGRGPQVSDACGDAPTSVRVQSQSTDLESSSAARDVRSAALAVSGRSLQATLQACGPTSRSHAYHVSWAFRDGCWMDLGYAPRRLAQGSPSPTVTLREQCPDSDTTPVVGGGAREVSELVLPASAAVFRGSDIVLTVPLAAVPAASKPRLAKGVTWPYTGAVAYDPELGAAVFAFGTYPDPDLLVSVRYDWASGRSYTVGSR